MALVEQTRPYEILIRHHADGTVAAHQKTLTEIFRDKVVVTAIEGDALPLDIAEVGKLCGDMLPTLCAERDALKAQVSDLSKENVSLKNQLSDSNTVVIGLQEKLDAANSG